jgi:hypothetical protein
MPAAFFVQRTMLFLTRNFMSTIMLLQYPAMELLRNVAFNRTRQLTVSYLCVSVHNRCLSENEARQSKL